MPSIANLKRDPSGSLINTDKQELKLYLAQREEIKKNQRLEAEVQDLHQKMSRLLARFED